MVLSLLYVLLCDATCSCALLMCCLQLFVVGVCRKLLLMRLLFGVVVVACGVRC